jgi:cold shock CspA family protein
MNGTIKKIAYDRGFGFLADESDGKEYFFHRSGLDSAVNFEDLSVGARVEYTIEASDRGPRAGRVRLV